MQSDEQPARTNDIIFYDGTCGLCHGFVKWVLRHDAHDKFQFAPLQGETLKEMVSAQTRAKLPDSVVLLTSNGTLLTKSAAVIHVLHELGSRRRAALLAMLPRWLTNLGYSIIARVRYRLFGRDRGDTCPVVPTELRSRFLP